MTALDDMLYHLEYCSCEKEAILHQCYDCLVKRDEAHFKRGWTAGFNFASAMHWHSVKTKLPEHGDVVLVCFGNKDIWTRGFALFHKVEPKTKKIHPYVFLNQQDLTHKYIGITHWQPLPAPPMQEVNCD